MKESLINLFMNFKKAKMKEICLCLLPMSICDSWKDYTFDRFLSTYIDVYYYRRLYTLDYQNVDTYDLAVVSKELDGICLELLKELENAEVLDDRDTYEKKINLTRLCRDIAEVATLFDVTKFLDCKKKEEYESEIDLLLRTYSELEIGKDSKTVAKLVTITKDWKGKETKFLAGPMQDTFALKITPYPRSKENCWIDLEQHVNKLARNYRKSSLEKNFQGEEVALEKLKTSIYCLQLELMSEITHQKPLRRYLLDLPESALAKKDIFAELVQILSNRYFQEHIVLVVPWNSYVSHRGLLNDYQEQFTFGVLVDFSHIPDVEKKMESLEAIPLFTYFIAKNVKNRDYNYLKNYEPSPKKTLLFHTFEEEEEEE